MTLVGMQLQVNPEIFLHYVHGIARVTCCMDKQREKPGFDKLFTSGRWISSIKNSEDLYWTPIPLLGLLFLALISFLFKDEGI